MGTQPERDRRMATQISHKGNRVFVYGTVTTGGLDRQGHRRQADRATRLGRDRRAESALGHHRDHQDHPHPGRRDARVGRLTSRWGRALDEI